MLRISTIVFDLDNTLWDVWPAIVKAEQGMYAFLAERYPRVTAKHSMESLRVERERSARAEPHMSHDFTYMRLATLKRCAKESGYPESMAQEAFDVFFCARNSVSLYRDVLPTLNRLLGRYRLFTLTNGNADLSAIGLKQFFDRTFAARDVGALKPDPAAFRHVLAHAGVAPEEVLHIGDDPVADVQGARGVGMHTAWLNRDGAVWNAELGAHPPTLTKLDDVFSLLHREVV